MSFGYSVFLLNSLRVEFAVIPEQEMRLIPSLINAINNLTK